VRATAIVPVKRFAAAKTRLGEAITDAERRTLGEAMLADVLAALERCNRVEHTLVVTGESTAREVAAGLGVEVVFDAVDDGHSEAATLGVRAALASGRECAALLPGDCPLLNAFELDEALEAVGSGTVGVVPDRHGTGTNALLLAPPDAIVPAFGPGSCERHQALAREAGAEPRVVAIPSLALDLDTPEDLDELRRALRAEPGLAPATAAALA